jgi:hypothetical protein
VRGPVGRQILLGQPVGAERAEVDLLAEDLADVVLVLLELELDRQLVAEQGLGLDALVLGQHLPP